MLTRDEAIRGAARVLVEVAVRAAQEDAEGEAQSAASPQESQSTPMAPSDLSP